MKKIRLFIIAFLLMIGLVGLASCTKTDTTKPVFKDAVNDVLPEKNILVKTNTTADDLLADVSATDDVDGNVKVVVELGDFDFNKVGQYTIYYSASDEAGNLAKVSRKINVIDTIAPYFEYANAQSGKLPDVETLQYVEVDLLSLDYLSIIDNYDTNLTATIENDGGFNYEVSGKYTVTYAVTDSSNNKTTATRDITVTPGIKYVEDVLKINGESHAAVMNDQDALVDSGSGLHLRLKNVIQVMTKEFYLQQIELNTSSYTNNGGAPYLPFGVAVVLDADYKPVLVRNATYAIEAVKTDAGWELHKGQDLTFVDKSAPDANEPVGVLGGNFASYIPDGGYVLLAGAPLGGNLDTCKIFLIKNLLSDTFNGGALGWEAVEDVATGLLEKAQFSFVEDDTTIYPKPDAMEAPVLRMDNHVLSWEAVTGAKEYEIYVDGELKLTTTQTSVKMIDLELEPSLEGESYKIKVKAITSDIRKYSDSDFSDELSYEMPNAQTLSAPEIQIEDGIVSWEEVNGAKEYEVYAQQVGDLITLGKVSTTSFNLKECVELQKLVANAHILVRAIGDGTEWLDSDLSNSAVYFCGIEQVIVIGEDRYLVIVTTAADYLARRNDTTDLGYATKSYLYLITDAHNFKAGDVEANGELVLFDKTGNVKAVLNALADQKQYFNGEWVDSTTFSYNASKQIDALISILAEGDQLLIGRSGGNFTINGHNTTDGRNVVANYYWGAYDGSADPFRAEHTVDSFPQFAIKPANAQQLEAPTLTIDGTNLTWEEVDGATGYEIWINGTLEETVNVTTFDLAKYATSIGKSGAAAVNYSDLTVAVVATGDDKEDSEKITKTYRIAAQITDGTTSLNVNYNLENTLWNGGSGANFRLNDLVAVLFTGASYKNAVTAYASGPNYASNGQHIWLNNSIVVVLDSSLKVKKVRFGFAAAYEIDQEYNITVPSTWDNAGAPSTNGAGNLLNLENEIADDEYVLITANAGSKAQLTLCAKLFVNSNADAVMAKTAIGDASLVETRIDFANTQYQIKLTVTEVNA